MATILDMYSRRVDSSVESDNLLGRLFWYTLSEMRVPHDQFTQLLTDAGITSSHPLDPKDANVFKRVCSSVKRLKIPTNNPDIFENYRMVEFRDNDSTTRRVVRERVNNAGRKLGFTELFDIVFDNATADLVFKPVKGFNFRENTVPSGIRDQVIDDFYDQRGCLNAYHIREWMRGYILRLGSTMVRPGGGVYFLREAHRGTIEALETIGEQLVEYVVEPSGKVEFHSLPLIDDTKQREMVQRAFEAETIDAIDDLLAEVSTITKGKKLITSDRYAGLLDRFQDLNGRTKEYEDLLEQKLASTSTRLSIFQQSLLALRKQVKEA
jgi:hypothetical protein